MDLKILLLPDTLIFDLSFITINSDWIKISSKYEVLVKKAMSFWIPFLEKSDIQRGLVVALIEHACYTLFIL
jgi:hypothetical protein